MVIYFCNIFQPLHVPGICHVIYYHGDKKYPWSGLRKDKKWHCSFVHFQGLSDHKSFLQKSQ